MKKNPAGYCEEALAAGVAGKLGEATWLLTYTLNHDPYFVPAQVCAVVVKDALVGLIKPMAAR